VADAGRRDRPRTCRTGRSDRSSPCSTRRCVYRSGSSPPDPRAAAPAADRSEQRRGSSTFIERRAARSSWVAPRSCGTGTGTCSPARRQFGIVEPLMRVQERINETTFEMLVAQYFQAFKQRYVLGWVPKDEQERAEGWRRPHLVPRRGPGRREDRASSARATSTRTSSLREAAFRDFAAIGQVPVADDRASTGSRTSPTRLSLGSRRRRTVRAARS
jgi:hypothetical protein